MRSITPQSWPITLVVLFASSLIPKTAGAQTTWTVAVIAHEVQRVSGSDAADGQDYYWRVAIEPTGIGTVTSQSCSSFDVHKDDKNRIFPRWVCSTQVTGIADPADPASGPEVLIRIRLREHDSTSPDDPIDIHPRDGFKNIEALFRPNSQALKILDLWDDFRCAGRVTLQGSGGDGDGEAKIIFSVSASLLGATDADSDGDGLPDSWEICGVDGVDLPALGADPYRKDLFVEIDWMADGVHTHEPWLPAMINAWNELNAAPITNPTFDGVASAPGVALHLDVGALYSSYNFDIDTDGTPEISVPASGDVDVNGDGIVDIGNLSALGIGSVGGGNVLTEDTVLSICDAATELGAIKAANFADARRGVFRYAVFGHQYGDPTNTSSGFACNGDDFIVTLGMWPQSALPGPAGLVVDGFIAHHVGAFLHELGHTLGLGHGGGDTSNCKPNYLSVMNYQWTMSGVLFDADADGLIDNVGLDYDNDGSTDTQRFMYSPAGLGPLDETSLTEGAGIGGAGTPISTALTSYGPVLDTDGDMIIDVRMINALSTQAIDWNRDGDSTDALVSSLAAPPNPAGILTDINNLSFTGCNASPGETNMTGFNDYTQIQNGGLVPPGGAGAPGSDITLEAQQQLERLRPKLVKLPNAAFIAAHCAAGLETITFEEFPIGTVVNTQYAPEAVFLDDAARNPRIVGPNHRNGVPTQSGDRSLCIELAADFNFPPPMVISFGEPQRMVGVFVGRTTPGDPSSDLAVLEAFDQSGESLGEVSRLVPASTSGITGFLGAGAVFPNRLISRIEIRYEGTAANEAVCIDQLTFCPEKTEDAIPNFPAAPAFGDLTFTGTVRAAALFLNGQQIDLEPGHAETTLVPLHGVETFIDGAAALTEFSFIRAEGTSVQLSAPAAAGTLRFLHWRMDDAISFPAGQTDVSFTMLKEVNLAAVYSDDTDGDGLANATDNCPNVSNPDQADSDSDDVGDACDACADADDLLDRDDDSVPDDCDNCPETANPEQTDTDSDGTGDACEPAPPPRTICGPFGAMPLVVTLGLFAIMKITTTRIRRRGRRFIS